MSLRRDTWVPLAIAAVCLMLALAGQSWSDRVISVPSDSTTEVVGRASLSYMTGIRRYAGAVLWNRIEPLLHGYYDNVPLDQQRYILSTVAAVEWLDPTFDQPYYVGSWILMKNDKVDEGMLMAREGLERIPLSGTLHMSYAQMLLVLKKDFPTVIAEAKLAIAPEMHWTDDMERIDGYAAMEQALLQTGETDLAAQVGREIDRLDALIDHSAPADVHDHNGDGVPDH